MVSGASVGSITWKALTGQSVVNVSAKNPDELKRSEFDTSHMPTDMADLSDADRLALQEEKANKHLKSFYAAGVVFDNTVRMLGGLGSTWGLIQGVMGHQLGGWIAVGAGAGAALTVTDAAFQVKMAAVNRNQAAAVDGTFTMVQGMGVMLTAMGLGRIPALVTAGAAVGKIAYGVYTASKEQKRKDELKDQIAAEKEAQKAAGNQPPASPTAQPQVPDVTGAQPVTSVPSSTEPPAAS